MSLEEMTAEERRKYSVGTLVYTKAGLFTLFAWLLWGDFCFQIMETVGGLGIIGLYMMEKLDASMFVVGVLTSTIPMLLGVFLGPIISFKSDRYRSKYGRRIPFMILTAPFLCLFLVSLGFSDDIYNLLSRWEILGRLGIPHHTATIALIGFLIGGFAFFNEFVNTVWWYLFADVVPQHFMGRFQGLFRVVNSVAGFFFGAVVVQHQLSYMRWVFIGAALLYFVGFSLMCWRVKEGEYPPVTDIGEKTTLWDKIKLYFQECFTHPIYIGMYCSTFFTAIAGSAGMGSSYFLLHISQHEKEMRTDDAKSISSVELTKDSKTGLSLGSDGKIRKWNLGKGDEAGELSAVSAGATHMRLMDDGTLAAISSDKRLVICDVASGEAISSVEIGKPAKALSTAKDGSVAVLFADGEIAVWKTGGRDMREVRRINGSPEGELVAVAISTDGSKVAACTADTIVVWDTASGGRLVAMANSDSDALKMKNLRALVFVPSIVDSEQGGDTAAGRAKEALGSIYHSIAGFFKDMVTNDTIYMHLPKAACRTTPDAWIVCGGEDSKLHVWNVADGGKVMSLKGHKRQINCMDFREDMKLLFSGGSDKMIYAWNLSKYDPKANDNSIRSYAGYSSEVSCISVAKGSDACLSGSMSGGIHVWNLLGGVTLKQMGILRCLTLILGLAIAYPFGALVDRFHPLRVVLITTAIIVPLQLSCFFFIVDYWTFLAMEVLKTTAFGLLAAGGYPMLITIFPKDKFGQFCSANGLANQFTRMLAGMLIGGVLMDAISGRKLLADNLRYTYMVCAFGYVGSAICLAFVYRWWKKLGGEGYAPPMSGGHGKAG